jgi:hypothetical protein
MIARIKAAAARFAAQHWVQSAVRHAVFAAAGVFVAVITVGGFQAVTVAVIVSAAAAAGRVLEIALVEHFRKSA